jgi:prepilin-type N-terminal cleavage/methylation domain-containing protein
MKTLHSQRGFTLIEIMIAISVFTIGILGVGMMQMKAISANNEAFNRDHAGTIAQAYLEELYQLDFIDTNLEDTTGDGLGGLDEGANPGGIPVPANADHSNIALSLSYPIVNNLVVGPNGNSFNVFWNIADTDTPDSAYTQYKIIRVHTYWTLKNVTRHSTVSTVKYNDTEL